MEAKSLAKGCVTLTAQGIKSSLLVKLGAAERRGGGAACAELGETDMVQGTLHVSFSRVNGIFCLNEEIYANERG